MQENYLLTNDVKEKTGKGIQTLLKWARSNNVKFIGEGKAKIYLWTEKDIENFIEYTKTIKRGRPFTEELFYTNNLDTLYHRLIRAKQNGDEQIIKQTEEFIERAKQEKKDTSDN